MTAVVADDAFGFAGGARGVEDVERIGGGDRDAGMRLRSSDGVGPIEIATWKELGVVHGPLKDDAFLWFVLRDADGFVEERLVGEDAFAFYATGSGDDHFGAGIVDADGEFVRGEAAKNDGMHGTEARTGEHRDGRFRNHRHVDHNAVVLDDTLLREHTSEARDGVAEFAVGEGLDLIGDGTVVDERCLVGAAGFNMQVERVVAGVELAAAEPAVEGRAGVVENFIVLLIPVNCGGGFGPEGLGVLKRAKKSGL